MFWSCLLVKISESKCPCFLMPQRIKYNYKNEYFFGLRPWKNSTDISFHSWVNCSRVWNQEYSGGDEWLAANKELTYKSLPIPCVCSYQEKQICPGSWKVWNKNKPSDFSFGLCMLKLLEMAFKEDEMYCVVAGKHSTWWSGNNSQSLHSNNMNMWQPRN